MDMEAGNRMETSDFVVGKGMEAHEADNDEEISEICLAPDLEVAEESRKQELQLQAQKIEEEIVTLKQALDRKEKQLAEIKRLLGITPWTQFRDGIQQQYQNLQGTQM
ncbi:PREDICTED: tumor protein D52-like [Acropora digitifera]|uniref:tumor protein D52-like n=1 Tax=Acropora digitifera TaxID=70779 RepID=UPI000779FA09|nr:PREDICTED: tumor protein D52-like [Acropora digitifera]